MHFVDLVALRSAAFPVKVTTLEDMVRKQCTEARNTLKNEYVSYIYTYSTKCWTSSLGHGCLNPQQHYRSVAPPPYSVTHSANNTLKNEFISSLKGSCIMKH